MGLEERRRKGPEDGSRLIVFIGNDESDFELEPAWNRGHEGTYDNGNGDTHVAVRVDDHDDLHALREGMGRVVKGNPKMGLHFIADPDGCWVEIPRGLDEVPLEAHRAR